MKTTDIRNMALALQAIHEETKKKKTKKNAIDIDSKEPEADESKEQEAEEHEKDDCDVKEEVEILDESYKDVENLYIGRLGKVANEISTLATDAIAEHKEAEAHQKKIKDIYRSGKSPSDSDRKVSYQHIYNCKYLVRTLEEARDALLQRKRSTNEDVEVAMNDSAAFAESISEEVNDENTAIEDLVIPEHMTGMRAALYMMERKETKGATSSEKMDSKASQSEKDWVKLNGGINGDNKQGEADINVAISKNSAEVGKSLSRGKATQNGRTPPGETSIINPVKK